MEDVSSLEITPTQPFEQEPAVASCERPPTFFPFKLLKNEDGEFVLQGTNVVVEVIDDE